jgi:long-chain acyl-CoA synthetase
MSVNLIADLAAEPIPPQRPAFGLCGDFGLRWISYAQFWSNARRASGVLAAAGIEPGCRILLWGSNTPEWVACLMGALLRGVVVVPLDVDSQRDNVARIATETSAKLVWHGPETDPSFLGLPCMQLESISEAPEPAGEFAIAVKAEDPAAILYTSGTTSEPRGVILTHGNIQAQLAGFTSWRVLVRLVSYRMLVIAPLSHVQGLMLGALLPVYLGLSIVFVRSVHPAHLLRVIRDYRITILSTVPRVLQVLTQTMAARSSGIRGLTNAEWLETEQRGWMRRHIMFTRMNAAIGLRFWVILVGGATLPRYDEQFWRDTGRFVVQGYGLTETTAIVALNGPLSRSIGSIGKPLGNVSLKIAEDGEILVRGATVTPGYFGAQPYQAPPDEYLRTGDLARSEKGRLYFMGRKKEMIVTGEGFNVYPSDLETVLLRTPGVVDAVVLGREVGSCEEVHAVLLLQAGSDPARVIASANEKLSAFQRIRGWTVWPEADFPRTSLMKVRRDHVLRELDDMESLRAKAGVQTLSVEAVAAEGDRGRRARLLAQLLLDAPPEILENHRSQSLADLGLSSLDMVALLTELERRRGCWLDHAVLPANPTIEDARKLAREPQPRVVSTRLPSRQPPWASSPIGRTLRHVGRPLAVGYWSLFCASITATWECDPRNFPSRFLLAAAPHRHWLDAIAICSALPWRFARRLLIITNRDFHEFFDPTPAISLSERLTVGFAYYLGMPFTFPFTIIPHQGSTREGLFETARMIDRGYCTLAFPKGFAFKEEFSDRHDPGLALLAAECNMPIIPVWIRGNGGLDVLPGRRRKTVKLAFGAPIPSNSRRTSQEMIGLLEASWQGMRRAENGGQKDLAAHGIQE